MNKEEAQSLLRQKIDALDIKDLALLVKIASEGLNDLSACEMIADIVNMPVVALHDWNEHVLCAGESERDLMVIAETALGWYDNGSAN